MVVLVAATLTLAFVHGTARGQCEYGAAPCRIDVLCTGWVDSTCLNVAGVPRCSEGTGFEPWGGQCGKYFVGGKGLCIIWAGSCGGQICVPIYGG